MTTGQQQPSMMQTGTREVIQTSAPCNVSPAGPHAWGGIEAVEIFLGYVEHG